MHTRGLERKVMNGKIKELFTQDASFQKEIKQIAQECFRKYKGEYNRVNLFEVEDLEQEIWAELLESSLTSRKGMIAEASRIANKHRMRGDCLPVEIPISQLGRNEKTGMDNLFYGNCPNEDDYGEESFP